VTSTLTTALHLLWTFSQLSILGFGGGKGIIPQMHRDAVAGYHWVTNTQFTEFYTIGKLVPGPTTIFAALIGFAAMPSHRWLGALIATAGMFVPSSVIMTTAVAYWTRFEGAAWRTVVSRGLAPAIVGLVWSSVWTISRGAPGGPIAYALSGIVAILVLRTSLSTPLVIAASGAVGILALH
jgi:chromate transporter